jgi:hypothetical protein
MFNNDSIVWYSVKYSIQSTTLTIFYLYCSSSAPLVDGKRFSANHGTVLAFSLSLLLFFFNFKYISILLLDYPLVLFYFFIPKPYFLPHSTVSYWLLVHLPPFFYFDSRVPHPPGQKPADLFSSTCVLFFFHPPSLCQ